MYRWVGMVVFSWVGEGTGFHTGLLKGLFKSLLSKIGSSFWKRKEPECEKEDPTPMPLLPEFFVPGSTPLIGVELKLWLSCLWNCTLRSRILPSQEFCKWKKLIVKSHSFWNIFSPVSPFPALLIDHCSRLDFSFGDLKKTFLISCLDIYLLCTPYEEQRKTWESPTTWVLGIELGLSD